MTARLIWVTGRAAAGKSTVIGHLAARLRERQLYPVIYNDEELLLGLVRGDTDHRHHRHPHGDDRLVFTTGHLFDQSLRLLNQHLLHELDIPGALAIVELARGRHTPPVDVTYRRAVQLFDPRLWPHSTVFRLEVDVDTQLARNAARHTGTGAGTPEEVMQALYTADDPEAFTAAGIDLHQLPAGDPADTAARILDTLTQP